MLDLAILVEQELGVVVVDAAGAAVPRDKEGRVALEVLEEFVHLFSIDVDLNL